ncbi:hypothetical protein [Luteolibacter marinus]|uniref:hypothetical protein n=1 Tax=Luteolibacter marinus TaxID=2776705 RepID=UPI0018689D8B|nr:hypothetical protein [Luteolibacter marinus]
MKLFTLVPVGAALALATVSCSNMTSTAYGYQAAGYSPNEAYHRGLVDGRGDKIHGLAYDPHINEDRTLPRAHRNDYLWGYVDGYRGRSTYGSGSK